MPEVERATLETPIDGHGTRNIAFPLGVDAKL